MDANDVNLFLDVPFGQRWECHKGTIHDLYIVQGRLIDDVAATMKARYKFDANVRQYKYHIKKWEFTKIVPKAAKDKAIRAIGKRVRAGNDVGGVTYKGTEVDKKRLRRHLRDESRLDRNWQLITTIFGTWSLPYNALKASSTWPTEQPSPFAADWQTPSDISILSPPNVAAFSPGIASSPRDAPTPTTLAIRAKTQDDRARYLLQGKTDELLKDMPQSEKRVATTWLYHFWFFAFKTSKYWGKGPRNWTVELLDFQSFLDASTTPSTPAAVMNSNSNASSRSERGVGLAQQQGMHNPSSLCRWSIHCWLPDYERVSSPPPEEEDIDLDDPDQWSHWRDNRGAEVFLRRLRDALQFNTFSTFSGQDIPLARSRIASAVANSPEILLAEAIGFAIMGRNEKLLFELLDHDPSEMDLTGLYPFHLAANYLEGSEACCNIFTILVPAAVGRNHIKNLHVNDFGHTVLDSLMMAILKSHTSCTPVMVDERLKKTQRFVGEDVDMCGRWDADSHCVRAANANGSSRVPFSWKHMFCHTSAQAICHAIPAIFGKPYSPDINTPSGLFTKSCSKCDMRLVPSPLHSLILTAFHLAQYGCEGENLFGILACLVCLLACGADSTIRVQMSAGELLGASNGTECDHCPIDPAQLGEQVPHEIRSGWTDEVKLGWDTILVVLRVAQQERYPSRERVQGDGQEMYFDFDGFDPSTGGGYDSAVAGHHALGGFGPGNEEEDGEERASHVEEGCEHFADEHSSDDNFCFGSKGLGTLWAAIQVELLTYRRLKDGDPWHSDRFNMRMVRDADKNCGGFLDLPLVKGEMLKPFCKCGRFEDARNHDIPTTEEACTFYFSNLEDWNRTNFLNVPYPDN